VISSRFLPFQNINKKNKSKRELSLNSPLLVDDTIINYQLSQHLLFYLV
ncbi:uncharacterized protein METZ01_LOCUS30037, partial [marine metagenome]